MMELIEESADESNGDLRPKADARWMVVDNEVKARCSLWWKDAPELERQKIGFIGHYDSCCAVASRLLLNKACEQLALRGCSIAIGPVDGNTWRQYRLVTERGSEPRFFLEPFNPEEWPAWFEQCGFAPLAAYSSALNEDLTRRDERAARIEERLQTSGVVIRPVRLDQFRQELSRIYSVASASFRNNFLYSPVNREDFIAQYEAIAPYIKPELCLIAEREGRAVGFIFAVPDVLQSARGQSIDTIIIKTVAALAGRQFAGLGCLMVDRCQRIAKELGYRRAIHALMHEGNNSRNISHRYAGVIRRYALFARKL